MLCTITEINGDYATVRYHSTGVTSQVAMFLLPEGADVGDVLKFENFEYERVWKPPCWSNWPAGRFSYYFLIK